MLSGRRSRADTVVNVAMVEFRFGAVGLIAKSVFNVANEKIGIAGSEVGPNHRFVYNIKLSANDKQCSVNTTTETGRLFQFRRLAK